MNQKGITQLLILGLILALIVVVFSAGSVYYLKTEKNNKSDDQVIISRNTNQNSNQTIINTNISTNANANSNTSGTVVINSGNANTNSSTNTNASIIETKDWKTYTNNDINISFEYPSSLGPVSVKEDDEIQWGAGKGVRVSTGEPNSWGGEIQLLYATVDYAPGREIWQGEVMSRFDKEKGLENICNEGIEKSWSSGTDVRYCTVKKVNGKWQAEYFTRIDALGGTGVIYFVKMFTFQTFSQQYPVGALALYLPDSNNIEFTGNKGDPGTNGYSQQDFDNLDRVYKTFKDRKADPKTNELLKQFDEIVSSFQYIK